METRGGRSRTRLARIGLRKDREDSRIECMMKFGRLLFAITPILLAGVTG